MYAFSCLVVEKMVEISKLEETIELLCVIALVIYFSSAQFSYVLHGILKDTDNQFKVPHRLGTREVSPGVMRLFMKSLIVFEVGAFATLFVGTLNALS